MGDIYYNKLTLFFYRNFEMPTVTVVKYHKNIEMAVGTSTGQVNKSFNIYILHTWKYYA